jgi:hypothetical protein
MKGGWFRASVLVGSLLVASACAPGDQSAGQSPDTSPSSEASPTTSPTTGPVTSPPVVSPPVVSPPAEPSPSVTITVATFHPGEVGLAYTPVGVLVDGGTQPYNFNIAGGALPPGLSMSVVGVTSGTPTKIGTSSFVIKVTDANGLTTTASKAITVVPQLVASGLCTKLCLVEQGCETVCGKVGSQAGGLGPYKYAVTAGAVPAGTTLSGLFLNGTFEPPSCIDCDRFRIPQSFTVKVTDSLGATDVVDSTYRVFEHITLFAPSGGCVGDFNNGCTVQLFYRGGGGSITVNTPTVVCAGSPTGPCDGLNGQPPPNTLPAGYSATADGSGTVTVTFPGGLGNGWKGSIELTLTDQSLCSPGPLLCSSSPSVVVSVNVAGS